MPKKNKNKNNLYWFSISLAVIILDQLTKLLILLYLPINHIIYVTPFFNLISARNPGAAFSFLEQESGWQNWLFAALAVIISIIIIRWLWKLKATKPWLKLALTLILGGAIGNLIDRIMHGYVIDFLDFHIGMHHWPAFNTADSAIVVGAILLAVNIFYIKNVRK